LVAEDLEAAQREEAVKQDLSSAAGEKLHAMSTFATTFRRQKAITRGTSAFLIQLGEGMEEIPTHRLFISAFTIGLSYFVGGLIPIIPYLCVPDALHGLYWSIVSQGSLSQLITPDGNRHRPPPLRPRKVMVYRRRHRSPWPHLGRDVDACGRFRCGRGFVWYREGAGGKYCCGLEG